MVLNCNGDAAADQLFRAINKASAKYGNKDRRTILILGQLIWYVYHLSKTMEINACIANDLKVNAYNSWIIGFGLTKRIKL